VGHGTPGEPSSKGGPAEFDGPNRHHSDPPYPPHQSHHYHHTGGSHLIQGGGSKTIPGGERSKHSKHIHGAPISKEFHAVPAQPPTLSQAPVPSDAKAYHSSIYATAGKSQAHPHVSRGGGNSPRPGSVNTASFRREHGGVSSSSMLRSMSEDDLRHHKRKHHEGARPHHTHRNPYEREHIEERVTHSGGEHLDPHAPPGLLVHQIPHGAPPSHFSPATSYTRLPPVMSITPLEQSKAAHEEAQKPHHYSRIPAAHVRGLERTMQLHERERERERTHHVERSSKGGGPRVPAFIPGSHELPLQPSIENWHDSKIYGCKSCGMRFSHKQSMETHTCQAGGKKHSPYHCAMCQIAFYEPREMHDHMITHHREALGAVGLPTERPPFWCSLCSRAFSSANSLKNHMKMHDKMPSQQLAAVAPHPPLGVEPNVPTKDLNATKPMTDCMKCNQRFAKPTDLTKHLNTPGDCPGT
jgi:Zinc-finger double-stranded RNA-binding.